MLWRANHVVIAISRRWHSVVFNKHKKRPSNEYPLIGLKSDVMYLHLVSKRTTSDCPYSNLPDASLEHHYIWLSKICWTASQCTRAVEAFRCDFRVTKLLGSLSCSARQKKRDICPPGDVCSVVRLACYTKWERWDMKWYRQCMPPAHNVHKTHRNTQHTN